MNECQEACEFVRRCVAIDWNVFGDYTFCVIITNITINIKRLIAQTCTMSWSVGATPQQVVALCFLHNIGLLFFDNARMKMLNIVCCTQRILAVSITH